MTMTVQEYIQELLDKGQLKGKGVAQKAGMSPSYFYRVVNGEETPSAEFIKKVAPHLPGASAYRMLVLAGYLSSEDGVEHESLGALRVRMYDLADMLGAAIEKYASQSGASNDDLAFMEGHFAKKALQLLLTSVEKGKVFDQFGFVEHTTSIELVEKLIGLREGQGTALIPVVEALSKANLHMADDAGDN